MVGYLTPGWCHLRISAFLGFQPSLTRHFASVWEPRSYWLVYVGRTPLLRDPVDHARFSDCFFSFSLYPSCPFLPVCLFPSSLPSSSSLPVLLQKRHRRLCRTTPHLYRYHRSRSSLSSPLPKRCLLPNTPTLPRATLAVDIELFEHARALVQARESRPEDTNKTYDPKPKEWRVYPPFRFAHPIYASTHHFGRPQGTGTRQW